jgi:hypothetical protein
LDGYLSEGHGLSTVAREVRHGLDSAFAAAIAVAAFGVVAASLLLGRRRRADPLTVAEAEPSAV